MATDIGRLYQEILGRAPDQAGLEYWQGSGLGEGAIRQGLMGSQEAMGRAPSLQSGALSGGRGAPQPTGRGAGGPGAISGQPVGRGPRQAVPLAEKVFSPTGSRTDSTGRRFDTVNPYGPSGSRYTPPPAPMPTGGTSGPPRYSIGGRQQPFSPLAALAGGIPGGLGPAYGGVMNDEESERNRGAGNRSLGSSGVMSGGPMGRMPAPAGGGGMGGGGGGLTGMMPGRRR